MINKEEEEKENKDLVKVKMDQRLRKGRGRGNCVSLSDWKKRRRGGKIWGVGGGKTEKDSKSFGE